MARKRSNVDLPPGFVLGSTIDIASWDDSTIAVDLDGRAHCFVGYMGNGDGRRPDDMPYFAPCAAARDRDWRESFEFVRLFKGALSCEPFLAEDKYYRILVDRWVVFPRAAKGYFGVVERSSRAEDRDLTRAIFGATLDEVEMVARAFARVAGRWYPEAVRLPRVTHSKTDMNTCDLTGRLIPREFPYVAFEPSTARWSHISLHGFFRLMSFLCDRRSESLAWKSMASAGLPAEVLGRFVDNGSYRTSRVLDSPLI